MKDKACNSMYHNKIQINSVNPLSLTIIWIYRSKNFEVKLILGNLELKSTPKEGLTLKLIFGNVLNEFVHLSYFCPILE